MQPSSADLVTRSFVHFDFVEFVDTNYQGLESAEGEPKDGYIIYNAYRKDFGYGTFRRSDDYTLEYDVLAYIKHQHEAFVPYITKAGGFYIEDTWHPVNEQGELDPTKR